MVKSALCKHHVMNTYAKSDLKADAFYGTALDIRRLMGRDEPHEQSGCEGNVTIFVPCLESKTWLPDH
jgi:hypothetical protein